MTTTDDHRNSCEGLKAANKSDIGIRFFCEFCKFILIYPQQLQCCGARLCRWCVKNGLSNREPFICIFCSIEQEIKEALPDRGSERELQEIFIVCYCCEWQGKYRAYLEHLQQQHAKFKCRFCHLHFFSINTLEEHQQELCEHRYVSCRLSGCMEMVKWDQMNEHCLSEKHQCGLLFIVSEYNNKKISKPLDEKSNEMINKEISEVNQSIQTLVSSHEVLSTEVEHLKDEIDQLRSNMEQSVSKLNQSKQHSNDFDKTLENLSTKSVHQQIELQQLNKKENESAILQLDSNSSTIIRFNHLNRIPFSIDSLKFRTSQYGYTFQIRACSTILSENKKFLSIFLTLVDGLYYNLLPFPYPYDIHLILCDQVNHQKHLTYVLKPDPNSPSFARPTNEKNEEYPIIEFCSLDHITNPHSDYVNDGVFFIRIFVDFFSTEKNPLQTDDNLVDSITETTNMDSN